MTGHAELVRDMVDRGRWTGRPDDPDMTCPGTLVEVERLTRSEALVECDHCGFEIVITDRAVLA